MLRRTHQQDIEVQHSLASNYCIAQLRFLQPSKEAFCRRFGQRR
jgi:hypothetical protein